MPAWTAILSRAPNKLNVTVLPPGSSLVKTQLYILVSILHSKSNEEKVNASGPFLKYYVGKYQRGELGNVADDV